MNEIWGELDARLSMVQRWVVVNTIKKQSVAEHCFNVERIARRIAIEWLEIKNEAKIDYISQAALHHDDDEAITGDLPSPSKWILGEKWVDSRRDLWYNRECQELDIVKLADKMEAYQFLCMEAALGNKYVKDYTNEIFEKMRKSAEALGVLDQLYRFASKVGVVKGTTLGSAPKSSTSGPLIL